MSKTNKHHQGVSKEEFAFGDLFYFVEHVKVDGKGNVYPFRDRKDIRFYISAPRKHLDIVINDKSIAEFMFDDKKEIVHLINVIDGTPLYIEDYGARLNRFPFSSTLFAEGSNWSNWFGPLGRAICGILLDAYVFITQFRYDDTDVDNYPSDDKSDLNDNKSNDEKVPKKRIDDMMSNIALSLSTIAAIHATYHRATESIVSINMFTENAIEGICTDIIQYVEWIRFSINNVEELGSEEKRRIIEYCDRISNDIEEEISSIKMARVVLSMYGIE